MSIVVCFEVDGATHLEIDISLGNGGKAALLSNLVSRISLTKSDRQVRGGAGRTISRNPGRAPYAGVKRRQDAFSRLRSGSSLGEAFQKSYRSAMDRTKSELEPTAGPANSSAETPAKPVAPPTARSSTPTNGDGPIFEGWPMKTGSPENCFPRASYLPTFPRFGQ
jgi:hypothetical protein